MRSWLKISKMDLTLITRVYLGSYLKSHSRPGLIGTLPYTYKLVSNIILEYIFSLGGKPKPKVAVPWSRHLRGER